MVMIGRLLFRVAQLLFRPFYAGLAWTPWHMELPLCRGWVVVRPVLDVGHCVIVCFQFFAEGHPLMVRDSFIVVRWWCEVFRRFWRKVAGRRHRRCLSGWSAGIACRLPATNKEAQQTSCEQPASVCAWELWVLHL